MSTYKVIQDIEAEDHILGPLSLRQFIYGLIAAFFFYLCFICITKHLAFALIIFLPPALFCTFFAFPFGKDQPTEVWALAKIRFLFKPRKRIWNQSGVKELVTITVPKKIEVILTDGLSQHEVKSRLRALADTIDSRGWVIKNVASSAYVRPGMMVQQDETERLLSFTSMPQPVPEYAVDNADILDDQSSPLAQQFNSLIQTSTQNHRKQLMENLAQRQAQPASPVQSQQWFTQKPLAAPQPVVATAQPSPSDDVLAAQLKARLAAQAQANLHLHTVPATSTPAQTPPTVPPPLMPAVDANYQQPPVTHQTDPAILNLAKRNDLNVSTLAHEASKTRDLDAEGEVVISLH